MAPRRAARRRDTRVPDRAEGPATRQEIASLRAELFGVLEAIAPRQRAVLVLRYFESLSVGETAAALGCTEGTVKSQTARGLAAARAALDDAPTTSTALMKEYL